MLASVTTVFDPGILPPSRPATLADWLAIPEERRAELIGGRIVYQGMPGPGHGAAQKRVIARIDDVFGRRASRADRPGGWWLSMEVDMVLGGMGCRPDLLGWRRERFPELPAPDMRGLVTAVPDWICEVLSHTTASVDLGAKRDAYHRVGVPWYWLVDPANQTLTVLRRTDEGYLLVLAAGAHDVVRAEPFAAADLSLTDVFDLDEAVPLTAP